MSHPIKLPRPVAQYVDAVNVGDVDGFLWTFADEALVQDVNRTIRGSNAIAQWARREIFGVNVRLDVQKVVASSDRTVVTMKIDGSFDRKGLPEPLLMDHSFVLADGRISKLEISLTEGP
jgi:ketosteroid isomerase-like protein